jgi:hypothetical protein
VRNVGREGTGLVGIVRWREHDQDVQVLCDVDDAVLLAVVDGYDAARPDLVRDVPHPLRAAAAQDDVHLVGGVRVLRRGFRLEQPPPLAGRQARQAPAGPVSQV